MDSVKQARGLLGFRSSKLQRRPPPRLKEQAAKDPPASGDGLETKKRTPSRNSIDNRLPERLQLLEEFYHAMEAAVCLLRIRHQICSFSAISAAVEGSTQRRFLRSHLAQIKHILPEVLQVDDHVSWNAEMQCSLKDLRITLHPICPEDAGHRSKSPRKSTDMVARRSEFHRRLVNFAKDNPQDINVPQAGLPDRISISSEIDGTVGKPLAFLHKPLEATTHAPLASVHNDAEVCPMVRDPLLILEKREEESAPPPPIFAFDPTQLKKFPRPPSKLKGHRHSPTHASASSHLPPIFKRHFSAVRQSSGSIPRPSPSEAPAACSEHGEVNKTATPSVSDKELHTPLVGEASSIKPHFSLKRCTRVLPGAASPVASSTNAPTSRPKSSSLSCASTANTSLSQAMSPPHRPTVPKAKDCQTPSQTPVSVLSNPFLSPSPSAHMSSPAVSTPFCDVSTPLPAAGSSAPPKLPPGPDAPRVLRKQAVKSLRFGTPSKRTSETRTPMAPEPTEPSNRTSDTSTPEASEPFSTNPPPDAQIASPLLSCLPSPSTPASQTSFATPKKSSGIVSRVLPFHSPINMHSPIEASVCASETHTPKRKRLSFSQSSESEQCGRVTSFMGTETGVSPSSKSCCSQLSATDLEILNCLPQELLDNVLSKERKLHHDAETGVEKARRRLQLIAGLPQLFNMVRIIFQSGNRTVLTRKDLTQKILASHPDITDLGEITEQLQLLVDLAPEWMSADSSSTGEHLYRINKNANMRAVFRSLAQAK